MYSVDVLYIDQVQSRVGLEIILYYFNTFIFLLQYFLEKYYKVYKEKTELQLLKVRITNTGQGRDEDVN